MTDQTTRPTEEQKERAWTMAQEKTETCVLSIAMGLVSGRASADQTMDLMIEHAEAYAEALMSICAEDKP